MMTSREKLLFAEKSVKKRTFKKSQTFFAQKNWVKYLLSQQKQEKNASRRRKTDVNSIISLEMKK